MGRNNRAIGTHYETMGQEYLQKQGYHFIERNVYTPFGEIDLIMSKEGIYYFIEVKYRSNQKYGTCKDAMTSKKLLHMKRSVIFYRKQHHISAYHLCILAVTPQTPYYQLTVGIS